MFFCSSSGFSEKLELCGREDFFCSLSDLGEKITSMRSGGDFVPRFPKRGDCAKKVEDLCFRPTA